MLQVLVVDDDPGIQDLIALTLRSEGMDVTTANNGEAALLELDHHQFDAIVLDLEMPIMDGRTFYHALRSMRQSTIPVLILSAYHCREARSELGAQDALNKPFDLDELVEHVQRMAMPTPA